MTRSCKFKEKCTECLVHSWTCYEKRFMREISQNIYNVRFQICNQRALSPLCDSDYSSLIRLQPEAPVDKTCFIVRRFRVWLRCQLGVLLRQDLALSLPILDHLMDGWRAERKDPEVATFNPVCCVSAFYGDGRWTFSGVDGCKIPVVKWWK